MSVFIFSLMAGLLLHWLLSIIQPLSPAGPKDGGAEYQINRWIVIRFEARAFVICKAFGVAIAILLFFAIVTILTTKDVHPPQGYAYHFADALTSPRMAAGVFGGLVGILLGNLLNRLFKNAQDYQFSSSDRLQLALIFALVVLGIGGEQLLVSAARRIDKISVGTTTEISFAEAAPKSTRVQAEQPEGAFRLTNRNSGGSVGLEKLYDIGSKDRSNIDRDKDFVEVLARYERQPVPARMDPGPLAKDILSPIASCLLGISNLYGDDPFVERQLSRLSNALQSLTKPHAKDYKPSDQDYKDVRVNLTSAAHEIAGYVNARANEFKELDSRYACELITQPSYDSTLPVLTNDSIDAFRNSADRLPYLAMAYAAVLAALHHYEAATIVMDKWIRAWKPEPQNSIALKWYLLRAQLTQGMFTGEWIRDRGAAASSSLRSYHIDNLKQIVEEMSAYAGISGVAKNNGNYKWAVGLIGASHSGDEGICDVPELPALVSSDTAKESGTKENGKHEEDKLSHEDATERLETIYNSYLSARSDYVDHALKHPIMKVNSASLIESEVEALMPLSLRCITYDQPRTRAEHIERYVHSRLNMLENASSLKSSDKIEDELRNARHLLALAFQLIAHDVEAAKQKQEHGSIQDRIAANPVLETYETLLATQTELQSFSEREVPN